jgi:hypothetical protein
MPAALLADVDRSLRVAKDQFFLAARFASEHPDFLEIFDISDEIMSRIEALELARMVLHLSAELRKNRGRLQ